MRHIKMSRSGVVVSVVPSQYKGPRFKPLTELFFFLKGKKWLKINKISYVFFWFFCQESLAKMIVFPLLADRSFEDDDSVDGNRSSSTQAAFKIPKVPKKPADSSAARRPSATGGKLGTTHPPGLTTVEIHFGLNAKHTHSICDRGYFGK